MWKKVLILAILALIYPIIESRKKKSDSPKSTKCQRTNARAFRYCTKSCSADKDCRSNQKCLCDGDCGKSCVKNNQKCDDPPKGRNLKIKVSNGRLFGSVATYTCDSPYKLRGSARRTCRAIGEWDGKKAKCRIICKDPGNIAYGNRRSEGFQAGRTIQYWCYNAYTLVGSPRITCEKSGQWSAPKPECRLPSCNPPTIPNSATVIYPRRMPKRFKYSDRVALKCKDGYFKTGIGVLECKRDDTWSGGITCSPKSCGRPSEISNGRIVGYVYSFKEKIRYVCFEGFKLKGPSYRICQANEEWSGARPICEAVNCGPLKKPDHGDIIEQVGFTFGERIVFKCTDSGYEMKGSRERRCQSDGTWSGSPTTCELVQCGDPGTPLNGTQNVDKGYVYGGSVTFICDKDYTLQGRSKIFCRADKSWSASVPRCLAPCPDPGVPYQGNKIGQDFRHDHTVRFTCPRDYVMEGVSMIKCSDGKWSNKKPSCKAPCQEPVTPAHGWKWNRDFRHGRSVRFSCSRGYQRVGAASITCNDGKWDNRVPVCKGICGRPRTPSSGRVHGNSFLDGDEVTFSCDKNYDLSGKHTLRCVGQRWDSSLPECKARCRFIGSPAHGFYDKGMRKEGDMIKHGVQITYGCFRDYTLVGTKMQECSNGRWTNDRPECKASCQSPGDIDYGIKKGSDYRHGKTVQYRCDAEYILEGQKTLTCNDGKWDSVPPICKAPCGNSGAPVHGWKQGDNFKHNARVQFGCNANYQLDGDQWIRCVDGVWSGTVPKCIAVCPDPGVPAKGRRLNNDFLDGKTVRFECNPNHDLLGNKSIKCIGGVWSGVPPECKGRCTFSGDPDNGYTPKRFLRIGASLAHGSNVEYACDASYKLTGSKVLHCSDGKWNASVPSCKASCHDPGFLAQGSKTGNVFAHGQTVIYECVQGYTLEGNNQITCVDGKWDSERPKCKASCSPLHAPSNGNLHNNQTKHGAVVTFSCNKGFTLNGSRQMVCLEGKWNDSSPTCQGSCKDPRPLIINGNVIGHDYSYGSSIEFRCNFGYRLHGSRVLSCVNGTWDKSIPECRKPCQDPGKPQNGWALGNNYYHSSIVKFVCFNRTRDLIGASQITCNDGKWSDKTPSCEAKCSDPGKPDNGAKVGDDYRSRANVTFRCNSPFELVGSHVITCKNGKWSNSTPTCSNCERPLGMENSNIQDYRITSLASHSSHPARYARLNGPFSWCTSWQTFLQIDLGKDYKLTAIATQGGKKINKWVERYTIGFYAGQTLLVYNESGSQKAIEGNKDSSSIVKYHFKEPFVSHILRIYPDVYSSLVCLRTELYGCNPKPDCILIGAEVWGLWSKRDNSLNYYKANIIKLNATHINFALQVNNRKTRIYKRGDPVLVIDKIPEIKDISVNSRVIAVHKPGRNEWYRAGTVIGTDGSSSVSVMFKNGQRRDRVPLNELRLVNRPRVCVDRV